MSDDFYTDNQWQRSVRDTVLAPAVYDSFALNGRYVFTDKGQFATRLQREFAVDTVLQGKNGEAICIEEKIVRWPGYRYSSFCLETHSCTRPGYESQGWMHYAQADYLLYCFSLNERDSALDCYLIDFPQLKAWFWPLESSFSTFGPLATFNATMGRKVPIATVLKNVTSWRIEVGSLERAAA